MHYEDQENLYLDQNDRLQITPTRGDQHLLALFHMEDDPHHHRNRQAVADRHSQCCTVLLEISKTLNDDTFHQALVDNIHISSANTSPKKGVTTPERLAKTWYISIDKAKRTLNVTTQRGIRSIANLMMSRQYLTNNRQLRYQRLRADVFNDTFISGVMSKASNKYAQVFGTSFHWSRCFPMKKKSEAPEALALLFKRDGVPNNMIVDRSMEQTQGGFKNKCREVDCRLKQLEPASQ